MTELRAKQRKIVDGFVELGLEYTNTIIGQLISRKADDYFTLRECIYYRVGAIIIHFELLHAVQKNHQSHFVKDPFDQRGRLTLLDVATQQQMAILDSIIFHSISLFDYCASLIEYLCGNRGKMSLKWTSLLKSLQNQSASIHKSPIAPTILYLNKTLVDRLYRHRSDIIHYRADSAGAATNVELRSMKTDFTVFAPKKLVDHFPDLGEVEKTHRPTIKYVSFWVCQQTLDGVLQLIGPLMEHLDQNRKTPKGFAIFGKAGQ